MNIFKKAIPTVAGALQGFHKAIADLKAVKEHHDAEAAKHGGIIAKMTHEAEALVAQAKEYAAKVESRVRAKEAEVVAESQALIAAAEAEARAAVTAIAKVESFLGL